MRKLTYIELVQQRHSKELNKWIVSGDTGLSSKSIWCIIMGVEETSPSVPCDSDDFGRCYRLLAYFNLSEKGAILFGLSKFDIWKSLTKIDKWLALEQLYTAGEYEKLDSLLGCPNF